jgi:predicted phosphodiesterase
MNPEQPMKYAVIADIHANLPALNAVLADIETQKCDRVVCLGDIVGYGRQPQECVALIRSRGVNCVKGNFDEYCTTDSPLNDFRPAAAESIMWTRAQLNEADRQWLLNLSYVSIVDGFTIVHANLEEPQRWRYVFDKGAAAASFIHQSTSVCFFGHTHVPLALVQDGTVRGGTYSKFKVDPRKQYFVNPGSVGQPRDNNPRPSYAIYDADNAVIELRRVDCDPLGPGGDVSGITSPAGPALPGPKSISETL